MFLYFTKENGSVEEHSKDIGMWENGQSITTLCIHLPLLKSLPEHYRPVTFLQWERNTLLLLLFLKNDMTL